MRIAKREIDLSSPTRLRFQPQIAKQTYGPEYRVTGTREDLGERWLANTPLLQTDHPRLRIQAAKLTQLKRSMQEKAVACFRFVQSLPFKCVPDSSTITAPQVLLNGCGDADTKATLLVALLRASGVPARMRLLTLGSAFLHGILDTDGRPVEHVISEVFIDSEWLGVDAYVVDAELGLAARVRLLAEHRRCGYAVHMNGQVAWHANTSAFGQFHVGDMSNLPLADLGVFDDPASFCLASRLEGRSTWSNSAKWRIRIAMANRRIRALRRSLKESRMGQKQEPIRMG